MELDQQKLNSIPAYESNKFKDKSGFFDLPQFENCTDPEHDPPTHLQIPQGKGYRHVCPSCGKTVIIKPLQIKY